MMEHFGPKHVVAGLLLYWEFKPSEHSGRYMYHQINIQRFYVLPTQCIYVFCVDLRTKERLFPYAALSDRFS